MGQVSSCSNAPLHDPYAPLFASILVYFFHPSNGAYVSELIQDDVTLKVYCDNLRRDEIGELLVFLEDIYFKYISVDIKIIKVIKEGRTEKYIKPGRD